MKGAHALLVGAALVVLTLLAGCQPDEGFVVDVGMQDNFFTREVVRVDVGDAVRFRNTGLVPHNAVDVERRWSTGEASGGGTFDVIEPSESVTVSFDEPGVFVFYCSLHAPSDASSGMVGVLVVGDVDYQAAEIVPDEPVRAHSGRTLRVPAEHPTIQNAVDTAEPGDLVLIGPAPRTPEHRAADGRYVYREQVEVATPYVTLRGTDRNEVIVDGEHERPMGIFVLASDGVAVENLTVRNATSNGLYFASLTGYRASYVTAHNNGVYGIYAFDATDGLFEHSYASGSPDAGFYIGQCRPCNAIIRGVVAEHNALGYSGTNASDVYIVASTWRHNISGIVPNTLDSQRDPPFHRVTIVGNLVHDNSNTAAPALDSVWPTFGNGVMLAGGVDSLVERNVIVAHDRSGILIAPNLHRNFWMTGGNVVRDNVIEESGYADITLAGPAMGGNCFAGNVHSRTVPFGLELLAGCGPNATAGAHATVVTADRGAFRMPVRFDLAPTLSVVGLVADAELGRRPYADHRDVPPPGPQPQMPADAPVVPAVDVFATAGLDLEAIATPEPPAVTSTRSRVFTPAHVPFGLGAASTFYGLLLWIAPFTLLAAWTALACVDLVRRDELGRGVRMAWAGAVFAMPFVGAAAYLLGGSNLPRRLRFWTVGSVGVVLACAVGAAVVGGLV